MLEKGDKLPDIVLLNTENAMVPLHQLTEKRLVLFFYAKDHTSGCTREIIQFNEMIEQFKELDTVVYGISPDNPESHRKMVEKLGLKYGLLSDVEHAAGTCFGAWGEITRCGKKTEGTIRCTFVFNQQKEAVAVFSKVKVEGHAKQVLEVVESL